MADWYGSARSNYFRVKDEAAFRKEAAGHGLDVWTSNVEGEASFMVTPNGDLGDKGGWPTWYDTDDDGKPIELDIVGALAKHLVEGEIAVLIEAGAEKLRYITGHTTAFNSTGKRVDLDLGDIYSKAARRFHVPVNKITTAEY